jgi:maleate isomerase
VSASVRLGFICPSSNTALEPAASALVLGHGSAHFSRAGVTRIALDAESDDQFDMTAMEAAADLLTDARVDVLAWAGTSGSWLGVDREVELRDRLAGTAHVPATTSTLAVLAACRAYGVRRLGLVSPYTAGVSTRIADELSHHGIDVVAQQYCGLTTNFDFATVGESLMESMIAAAADGADAVAVMCTNMDGVAAAARTEAAQGIPVIDSIAATVWHSLLLAGSDAAVAGRGDLLANGTLRARMQTVAEQLRSDTGADRTTLRVDLPEAGCSVNTCAAESCGTAVRSIRRDPTLPQRDLETVRWIDRHRTPLVQPDFAAEPHPPQALLEVYGVRAQMLAPVIRHGEMVAWLSVHSLTERPWSAADQQALAGAVRQIDEALNSIPDHARPTLEVI